MAKDAAERRRIAAILRGLSRAHPDARCSLDYRTAWQLLVATILSAQCTDARVNKVTPALFARYPGAPSTARATQRSIESLVRSTGFFRSKARSILGAARAVVARHGGRVPRTLEDLVGLPGVGRKTAHVVLGNAYGVPGITVDTHVGRLARRLGLSRHEDPEKVEIDLMGIVPQQRRTVFSHQTIQHGRRVCRARRPLCWECVLAPHCPSRQDAGGEA